MHWPNVFDKRGYKWMIAESEFMNNKIYRDCHRDNENAVCHIQSKIIRTNYLEFFVRYDYRFDLFMDLAVNIDGKKYLSELFEVFIDDSKLNDLEWHPNWSNDISNIGMTAMISIKGLQNGKHTLSFRIKEVFILKLKKEYKNNPEIYNRLVHNYFEAVIIPFWKDS